MKKKVFGYFIGLLCCISAILCLSACRHTHVFSDEWTADETGHWHKCTGCDEQSGRAEHTWDGGIVTTQPDCTKAGTMRYTCTVCGATKTEEIAATGHTFSDEWTADENNHWHKCTGCDEKSGSTEHTWDSGIVTAQPDWHKGGRKTLYLYRMRGRKDGGNRGGRPYLLGRVDGR